MAALGALFVLLSAPAAADATNASYTAMVPDQFPDDPRLTVGFGLTGGVAWDVGGEPVGPGESADRGIRPAPGALRLDGYYEIRPTCCPYDGAAGRLLVDGQVPVGCADLAVPNPRWNFTIEVCGTLRADLAQVDGPGEVTADGLSWGNSWDERRWSVEVDAAAAPDQAIEVEFATFYDVTVSVSIQGPNGSFSAGPAAFAGNPADAPLKQVLDIEVPDSAATTAAANTSGSASVSGSPQPAVSDIGPLVGAAAIFAVAWFTRRR